MTGKEIYAYTNETYTLNKGDYIFYKFNTWDFGAAVALRKRDYIVVEGIHINYCTFENCNIKNIIFKNDRVK